MIIVEQAKRIQTSLLNGIERKVLVWLAKRQPSWMTSDKLTFIGTLGALLFAVGFILSGQNVAWLWLSSFGLVVNWYGDSLDGTLARVRNTQRPVYGYYLDHTVDCINESLMFFGIGLSPWMRLDFALTAYVIYLFLTLNVSINAHLRGEFKLTYGKLGPTEFRLIMILVDTAIIYIPFLREASVSFTLAGTAFCLGAIEVIGLAIIAILLVIYLVTIYSDIRYYASKDPLKK